MTRLTAARINHFAPEARDPEAFTSTRAKLIQAGCATETVFDAPDLYTIFTNDPDGLFIELVLGKPANWTAPFATQPYVGGNQSALAT